MRRLSLFALTTVSVPVVLTAAPITVLYDPLRSPPATETLSEQGWLAVSTINFSSPGAGFTNFDSFPNSARGAWTTIGILTGNVLHPSSQIHDSATGFTLRFELAIDEENHDQGVDIDNDGLADEAGFTILLLDSNAVGVALNFWEDRIWTSSDQFSGNGLPLPQAEFVTQEPAEMATLRAYALTIMRGAYRLTVDGVPILEGSVRNYDLFTLTLNPFNKPNIINIGDASDTAGARARLGKISIETCYTPPEPFVVDLEPRREGLHLKWPSVPGATYTVQGGSTLEDWSDLTSFVAASFSASFFVPYHAETPTRFFRVLEFLP